MAAAAAEPNGASIEALFRPSTRFQDSHPKLIGYLPENCTEVELLPGLTIGNIRVTRTTWDAFDSFLHGKVAWMSPDVFVCQQWVSGSGEPLLLLGAIATSMCVQLTPDTAAAATTATCDFAVRLLATCEQDDLYIIGSDCNVSTPISGAGISLFFQESRDSLQKFTLQSMALSEDQCLALATMSRLDVELTMERCSLSNNAAGAFVECLQSDRGPIKLHRCEIDTQIVANALAGKSRVTRFQPDFDDADDADKAILFRALANNRGLVELDLHNVPISDENWMILCRSLQAHPTLTTLCLYATTPWRPVGAAIRFSGEQKSLRTRALVEMIQENAVLQTITLSEHERDEHIYTQEIKPYLVTNQLFSVRRRKRRVIVKSR
jgi:hypothetical protein